ELLAVLLLRANEVVSRDLLIEALWGERLPANPRHSLDVQISRLRGVLGDGAALSKRGEGYVLEVSPENVDAAAFERLLADGSIDAALALWRGAVLVDVAIPDVVIPDVERLEESRLAAIEERADGRLAQGRHEQVVAELEPLVAKHPY